MWPWHAALFFSSPSMQTVVLVLKLSPSSQFQPSLWITFSSSFLTHRTSFTVSTGTILNHYLQKQSMCLTGWGWGREGFHSHCSDIGKGEEKEDTLSWSKKKTIYYFLTFRFNSKMLCLDHSRSLFPPVILLSLLGWSKSITLFSWRLC